MTAAVLVAELDPVSRRQATKGLRHGGFDVAIAHTTRQIISLLRRRQLVGIVVDPGTTDPVEVIKDLRTRNELPIIVVSDRTEEWDKVELLDAGADDYLTKPFGAEELVARLKAVLRRVAKPEETYATVVTDDFAICIADRRFVRSDGAEVALSPTEWKIVELLVSHPKHLVTHATLLRTVWGPDAVDKQAYLRVYMRNIRRKVETDPARPRYFLTVPGLGLRFEPDPIAA
jgi:two-component system, OmpR family, KDP operon response regulator KdpE